MGRVNLINSRDIEQDIPNDFIVEDQTSIDWLLEKEINRDITLFYSVWGLDIEKRYEHISRNVIETQNIGYTGVGIELDYRNDPFNTTKGTYSEFNVDFAAPFLGSTRFYSIYEFFRWF